MSEPAKKPRKPRAPRKTKKPSADAVSSAKAPIGIDGNATDEPMRTLNQEYKPDSRKNLVGLGWLAGSMDSMTREEHIAKLNDLATNGRLTEISSSPAPISSEDSENTEKDDSSGENAGLDAGTTGTISPSTSANFISVKQTKEQDTETTLEAPRTTDGTGSTQAEPTASASEQFQCANTENQTSHRKLEGNDGSENQADGTPQTTTAANQKNQGDVANPVADGSLNGYDGPIAREESRAKATNRWTLEGRRWETEVFRRDIIRQCRASGMTKEVASDHAWEACLAQFPPPGCEPEVIEPPEKTEIPDEVSLVALEPTPIASDQGVPGLGTIPDEWPQLPANAQLQVEIAWVSANRLRVRSGTGVDLSRALSPAPSYSALSWLETSILFPSKFADISVKATADQDDEREHIKREKMAIEEIRSILAEMLEG